jgi:hypothetical protein
MREMHYRYWIGIVLALFIGALTVKWYDIKDLANLLSFGLALSSLILAVIAIVQALISGSSLSSIIGSIGSSVDQVKSAATQIDKASEQLLAHAAGIPPALGAMSARFEQTQEIMQKLLSSDAQSSLEVDRHKIKEGEGQSKISNTREIWERTTVGGSIAYYICNRGFETKKSFVIPEVLPTMTAFLGPYVNGFVAGIRASGMMDIDSKDNKFTVKGLGNLNFIEYLNLMNKYFDESSTDANAKLVRDSVEIIDKYFENKPDSGADIAAG